MILPLEKQVCSLELAKKLKKLGVPQDSLHIWELCDKCLEHPENPGYHIDLNSTSFAEEKDTYAAYNSAELDIMLPSEISNVDYFELCKIKIDNKVSYSVTYQYGGPLFDLEGNPFDSEIIAKPKMLIYLLENNLCSISVIKYNIEQEANNAK